MRLLTKTMLAMSVAAMVAGCGEQVGPKLEQPVQVTDAVALFNPTAGAAGIPFPTDLMFNGTVDGSLNIPGANPAFAAMNTLNGFSTTAPMVIRFSGPVDNPANPDDVKNGILLFSTNASSPSPLDPVTSVTPLVFGVDYAAGINGGVSGMIFPLKPLEPSRTHLVVVTSDLQTRDGEGEEVGADELYQLLHGAFLASQSFATAASFAVNAAGNGPCDYTAPIGCQLNPAWQAVAATDTSGLDPDDTDDSKLLGAVGLANTIIGLVTQAQPSIGEVSLLAVALQQANIAFTAAQAAHNNDPSPANAAALAEAGAALAAANTALQQFVPSSALVSLGTADTLREQVRQDLTALAAASVDVTKVVLSYRVTTQDIGTAQANAKAQVDGSSPTLSVRNPVSAWATTPPPFQVVSPGSDGEVNNADDHSAHIYLATLNDIIQFVDPEDPNNSVWSNTGGNLSIVNGFNPEAVKSNHSIPVLISAPRPELLAADCAPLATAGLPVVIFQHGITSNRGSMMALADTLAKACTVGVAIDLPKHGITSTDPLFGSLGQLHAGLTTAQGGLVFERLVKVESPADDCQAGAGAAVGNGDFYCPSGDNFVNLANLANSRDTLRQAAIDLHSLYKALVDDAGAALNAGTIGTTIDAGNIHFVGMSLGGIVGGVFAAHEPDLKTVTLNVAGGGIAKILDGSPSFEPQITAGLAANGVVKPGGDYEGFLIMAQTVVDSADPINYTSDLAAHNVLMQVVLDDQVVPNNTFGTSFGPAWGRVAQTGQNSFLLNQNFLTVPVGLSGSDPLAQGTGFVVMNGAYDAGLVPEAAIQGLGVLGADAIIGAPLSFKGLGLAGITGECTAPKGVVRFAQGGHSSLLDPSAAPAVTAVMQAQIASFVTAGSVLDTETALTLAGLPETWAAGLIHKGDIPTQSNIPCP